MVVSGVLRLLELVADSTSTGLLVATPEGRALWANRALADLVDTPGDPTEVVGVRLLPHLIAALENDGGELEWNRGEGARRWFDVRCRRLPAEGAAYAQELVLYEVVDATARHERDQEVRRREFRFARLEALAGVGTWEWDLETDAIVWSDELVAMFGFPPGTTLDYHEFRSLLYGEDVPLFERILATALETGEPFHSTHRMFLADRVTQRVFESYGEVISDRTGKPMRVLATAHDITEQRRVQAELAYLAERDPLTSLPNQRGITAQLRERFDRDARTGALLVVDIDDFKCMNERHGQATGDQILCWLPPLLLQFAEHRATLGRLGGDEFAVLLPDGDAREAVAVARAIVDGVARNPFPVGGGALQVKVSVGVAAMGPTPDADTLLAEADQALRWAKAAGKSRADLFDPARRAASPSRSSVLQRVEDALDKGLMALHAQPVVDLSRRSIVSYELLLRLRDEIDPPLSPAAFLAVVERDDVVLRLDRWVVEQAVAALAAPRGRARGLRLEVNTSMRSLADPTFADHVIDTLKDADVDPGRLGLEITETAAITSPDTARHLADQLARAGCRFILDDFSAGLGSFVHLKHLPFTAVKIAGTFLRHADWTLGDKVLVESVVQAARGLGLRTVAKHVERESLVGRLHRLGVHRAQGFHLGRPVPLRLLLEGRPAR